MTAISFFATAPLGMTDLLAAELSSLGAQQVSETSGGVSFEGDLALAYRACLWSRIANRILLPIAGFEARDTDALYAGAKAVEWLQHLDTGRTFAIDANVSRSGIDHSHYAALRIKDAIVDQLSECTGERPSIDTDRPDVQINAHIKKDRVTLSIDLSGNSLHQRGYRLEAGPAPLKENLAAAILMRCRWPDIARDKGAFVDPMCGSGTLVIEAAMMAADVAPALHRDYFGFSGWKGHQQEVWSALKEEARARRKAGLAKIPPLMGFDADRRVLDYARANAARAGLENAVAFSFQKIEDFRHDFPSSGLVACNPPYGKRLLESGDLQALYQALGRVFVNDFDGWHGAVFTQDGELGRDIGLRSHRQHTLYNGALPCKLIHFDIQSGNLLRFDRLPATLPDNELSEAANGFRNRLRKNLKPLRRWAIREHVSCYRLYDADLPDYAVAVDVYADRPGSPEPWLCIQEYEAPKSVDARKAKRRLREVRTIVQAELGLEDDHLFFKTRARQKGERQYEKQGESRNFHEVSEGNCRLRVNFEDYLDTGLFLDHRPIRLRIGSESKGKRFLNLFCYTGAATVHAALGGANASLSIDMSKTYLDWAGENLRLNGLDDSAHVLLQADCIKWLKSSKEKFDLIFLDPPTFSNSKRMETTLDIQRDHSILIADALRLLTRDGTLYFSTNLRTFKLDDELHNIAVVEDISQQSIPFDFKRRNNIHRCFRIRLPDVR